MLIDCGILKKICVFVEKKKIKIEEIIMKNIYFIMILMCLFILVKVDLFLLFIFKIIYVNNDNFCYLFFKNLI